MPKVPIYWRDKVVEGTNSFFTLQEFANFLKDNPEIAKALGYVPINKN
jgi:hypothetical protein